MFRKRWAEIRKQSREILEDRLLTDLRTSPRYPDKMYLGNVLSPVLAHLFGEYGGHAKMLKSDSAGDLLVSRACPTHYNIVHATLIDNWTYYGGVDAGYRVDTIDIYTETHPANFQFITGEPAALGDTMALPANSFYSFSAKVFGFQAQNHTPGSNAVIYVIVWMVPE